MDNEYVEFAFMFLAVMSVTATAAALLAAYAALMGADFGGSFLKTFPVLLATGCFMMAWFKS